MSIRSLLRATLWVALATAVVVGSLSHAGGHTWRVKEIFSNADGTIQYIEVWEANGTPGEIGTANHSVTSNTNSFTIPSNVAAPTTFRSLLLATQGFADLGIVAPDYIIADNFFAVTGDSISYTPLHTVTFGPGQLPTDGILALAADLSQVVNSPENYAGEPPPPGVPATGPNRVTVAKSAPGGSQLGVTFDITTCVGDDEHQLVLGFGSMLPAAPGGAFSPSGAVCQIVSTPFEWTSVPDPSADASGLLWFLVQATDGVMIEGSWGTDGNGVERVGPGPNGSSDRCGMVDKSLANTCGQ